jgi:isopenicillin-N epimerase
MNEAAPEAGCDRAAWLLDPRFTFLNHGSFGATPRTVLAEQDAWRRRMEAHPGDFFARLPRLLREAAQDLASCLGGAGDDYVFVENATAGCNAVLASLSFAAGDEVLLTDHAYPAVQRAAEHLARRTGVRLVTAQVPYPVSTAAEIIAAVAPHLGARTRLALFDHVTSPTAVIFPVKELTALARAVGALVLIDGAHAPGMLALDIPSIGADYYVGNCHKWLMAPKGSAFLWASPDSQAGLHPLVISHGYRQGFAQEFDWTGTRDPSAWLSIPAAIAFHRELGGERLRRRNIALAQRAGAMLAERLASVRGASDALTGAMATVRVDHPAPATRDDAQQLRDALNAHHAIDVAVTAFAGRLWLRISAQAYNAAGDYLRLAEAMCQTPFERNAAFARHTP